MRETLLGAAKAFGLPLLQAQIEQAPDEQLRDFIRPLMQAGGMQLQSIGIGLQSKGHAVEGAKAQAEGKFYESF